MLPALLRAHLKADVTVAWPEQAPEACKVFDFEGFSEQTREAIYDLLTDADIDRVEAGALVPFAVVGLVSAEDDIEDTSPDGVLFLDGDRVLYALAYEDARPVGTLADLVFAPYDGEAEEA